MAIDLEGKHCRSHEGRCVGEYKIASLCDDWEGILTCNACGAVVPKWVDTPQVKELKDEYEKGFNLGVEQAKEEILDSLKHFVSDMKIGDQQNEE